MKNFLSGYRTIIGGLIQVGLGAYLIAVGEMKMGVTLIGTGASTIGLGGKGDKIIQAIKEKG